MKRTLLLTALLTCLGTLPALAEPGPYVSGSVGGVFSTDATIGDIIPLDTGVSFDAAGGYKFGMSRLEGALDYQNIEDTWLSHDTHVRIFSVMANGYLDFDIRNLPVTPYIMAGMGVANVDATVPLPLWSVVSGSDTVFAWQLGAGLGIRTSQHLTIDLGYRYFAPADAHIAGQNFSINTHIAMAGLRYQF